MNGRKSRTPTRDEEEAKGPKAGRLPSWRVEKKS